VVPVCHPSRQAVKIMRMRRLFSTERPCTVSRRLEGRPSRISHTARSLFIRYRSSFKDLSVIALTFLVGLYLTFEYDLFKAPGDVSLHCQGKVWCLIELGGIPCLSFGLTLKRGGFIKSTLADCIEGIA
jgi:hypothetical protein